MLTRSIDRWILFSYFTDLVSFRYILFSYFTDFVSFRGTTKLRNENETKRNTTKRNMKKRNETKRNEVDRYIIDHLQEELYLCKLFSHLGL